MTPGHRTLPVCLLLLAVCSPAPVSPTPQTSAQPSAVGATATATEVAAPSSTTSADGATLSSGSQAGSSPGQADPPKLLVRFAEPQAVGALSSAHVATVAYRQRDALVQACHRIAKDGDSTSAGLSVHGNGSVREVTMIGEAGDDTRPIALCVKKQLKTWKFPNSDLASNVFLGSKWISADKGALDQATLMAVIAPKRALTARACASHLKPGKTERVEAQLVIQPDGHVSKVSTEGKNEPLRSCLDKQLKSWMFPSASKLTTVRIPFLFKRK